MATVQHSPVSLRLLRATRLIRSTALGYRRFTVLFAHWARQSLGGCRAMTACARPAHSPESRDAMTVLIGRQISVIDGDAGCARCPLRHAGRRGLRGAHLYVGRAFSFRLHLARRLRRRQHPVARHGRAGIVAADHPPGHGQAGGAVLGRGRCAAGRGDHEGRRGGFSSASLRRPHPGLHRGTCPADRLEGVQARRREARGAHQRWRF